MITGNIVEWSEFYAFIKILTDKIIYSADENLNKIEDNFYFVLEIIREETQIGTKIYDISKNDEKIHIKTPDKKEIAVINSSEIKSKVNEIFEGMKGNEGRTFSIQIGKEIMEKLQCTQIKASSATKQDLIIKIHDPVTTIKPELGFSIKSMLGSPSTLLNSSGATNLRYKIIGENIDIKTINSINTRSKIQDRVNKIYEMGGEIEFDNPESEIFRKNIRKIDSLFPEVLAEIVLGFFAGKGRTISELVEYLDGNNILSDKFDFSKEDVEYKIKEFLVSIALGMTPAKEWDGYTKAHGGYIIVKENGEIVCYHLYNRNEFQEYLYSNTRLD
ncbi:HpaII family restriction endonuclease, partial [Patescibacteria group bacterium]|nr:HpaII family restriction endonuclease [Patescibacteria group bacterium]